MSSIEIVPEKDITKEEATLAPIIRQMLANKDFDKLYNICPKHIAKLINSKYRVVELTDTDRK